MWPDHIRCISCRCHKLPDHIITPAFLLPGRYFPTSSMARPGVNLLPSYTHRGERAEPPVACVPARSFEPRSILAMAPVRDECSIAPP